MGCYWRFQLLLKMRLFVRYDCVHPQMKCSEMNPPIGYHHLMKYHCVLRLLQTPFLFFRQGAIHQQLFSVRDNGPELCEYVS